MRRIEIILFFAFLAACKAGGDYEAPSRTTTATAWSEASSSVSAEPPLEEWWKSFGDPVLERLVRDALDQGLDLELARARVMEARALRDVAAGGDDPQVDLTAGYARARRSENSSGGFGSREDDVFRAGFDASWELDFFGRIDRRVEAAEAGVDAAVEARRDVTITLLGDVASTYVELRGAQRALAVARENLAAQRETLELTRGRVQAGMASQLDEKRAEALAATTEATLPAFDAAVRQSAHRLAVLLGREPEAFLDLAASDAAAQPAAPDVIAAGLPADLLRRRPDVRRAERELAQQFALTNAARGDLYPRISLVGSWGQTSTSGTNLLDAGSNAWSIGPSLVLPIFEGGILRANVRAQEARERQALVAWQIAVLRAQAEVEDAIVLLSREKERNASLVAALAAQQRAVDLATDLFSRGLVDYFQVLEAQRARFDVDAQLARSSTNVVANAVALYKALGGGWSASPDER